MVFIQFAGFTFGKSASAYATPWHGYPGNNTSFLMGGHDTVTGVNNIQYTAQFGNGVSGTIGLDDPTVFNRTALYNLSQPIGGNGLSTTAYGGFIAPDLVGNIRVDQAWGLFQISGALHTVNASYNNAARLFNTPGCHQFRLVGSPRHESGRFGDGCVADQEHPDRCLATTSRSTRRWAKGDTKNVISTSASSPSFLMMGGTPVSSDPAIALASVRPRTVSLHRRLGYGASALAGDGSYPSDGSLWCSWCVQPQLGSVLVDELVRRCGLGAVRRRGHGRTSAHAVPALNQATITSCNPNFSTGQIGLVTRWTPVKNLTFSAEAMYFMLHQNIQGSAVFTPGGAPADRSSTTSRIRALHRSTFAFNVTSDRLRKG